MKRQFNILENKKKSLKCQKEKKKSVINNGRYSQEDEEQEKSFDLPWKPNLLVTLEILVMMEYWSRAILLESVEC